MTINDKCCGYTDYQILPKYWYYWCDYANICKIDPFRSNISCPIKLDVIVTAFAARIRSGVYSKNATIKIQGVIDAFVYISKTTQVVGKPSPFYREEVKYQLVIQHRVEDYRRADPLPVP